MKYLFAFLILYFGFFIQISFALECDLIVTGAGTTAVDGTYVDTGTLVRGEPQWSQGIYYLSVNSIAYDPSLLYWMITTSSSGNVPNLYYRSYAGGYVGVYSDNSVPPAPTVTEDCPDPPITPLGTTTPFMTYYDALYTDMWTLFCLAFIPALYFNSRLTPKK